MKKAERDFAVKVLQEKKEMVQMVGFATERPDLARWQIAALNATVEYLTYPRYIINPFV